ncbi:hypothetical protein VB737_00895, partial [Synechococcus sp. BA-120 BA3]|nr:hypothetical protein [Synechococcus sp. BA-120 BA3]
GEPRRGGGDGQPRQVGRGGGGPRIDPFARPSRPAAPVAVIEAEAPAEAPGAEAESEAEATEAVAAPDAVAEAAEGAMASADSEGDATPEA